MFPPVPPPLGEETLPDLERLAEKWYAGAIKSGGAAALLSSILKPVVGLVAGILGFLFSVLDPIAVALAQAILNGFQTAAGGPMDAIAQIALTEFQDALSGGGGRFSGAGQAGRGIASVFIDRIVASSSGGGSGGVAPSLDPAKTFLGMMTELTVRGWALGLLGELETAGFIKGFEDLIGDISRSMGMGRLARVALQPLIQTIIGGPAVQFINQQYRPTLLNENLAVKQVIRGLKDQAWLSDELGKQGYSDDRIEAILEENRNHLTPPDLTRLLSDAFIDDAAYTDALKNQGWLEGDIPGLQRAIELTQEETLKRTVAQESLTLLKDGAITLDTFDTQIDTLAFTQNETHIWKFVGSWRASLPRRSLTVGQLESCLAKNLITLGEFRDHLTALGFSTDDATLVELLQQTTLTDKAEAAAAKKDIAAQKAAAAEQKQAAKIQAAKEKATSAAQAKADRLASLKAKQAAADAAHLARVQQTEAAAAAHAALIADAEKAKLITSEQAAAAKVQLTTITEQSKIQAAQAIATTSALDQAQSQADAAAVQEKITAEKAAAITSAAQKRAELDQELLDNRQADRVAGFQLARDNAQASFDAGEITASSLAKKLRAIDLQEQKAIASENIVAVQLSKAQLQAEAAAAKAALNVSTLAEKTTALPAATQRRQNAVTAAAAAHLQTVATVSAARTTATANLTAARVAALDAATAKRAELDQQLADQKTALEKQIIANQPPPV